MSHHIDTIVRQFVAAIEEGNASAAIDLHADNFVDHAPHSQAPGMPPGKEGTALGLQMYLSAFSISKMEVVKQVVSGNMVAIFATTYAKHTGDFMNIPATHKDIALVSTDILRIENGKIAERWGTADIMGMMQQLGVLPTS